jgi:hypothetical protein
VTITPKKGQARIPSKTIYDDVIYNQSQDIVDSFADYFMNFYSTSSVLGKFTVMSYSNSFWPCITLKKLNKLDVAKAWNRLKPKISSFIEPLVHIFNLSLEQGVFDHPHFPFYFAQMGVYDRYPCSFFRGWTKLV